MKIAKYAGLTAAIILAAAIVAALKVYLPQWQGKTAGSTNSTNNTGSTGSANSTISTNGTIGKSSISKLDVKQIDDILEFAREKVKQTAEQDNKGLYPRTVDKKTNQWKMVESKDWTAGFFPGCLWYAYEQTNDKQWKDLAEKWTEGIRKEQYNTQTHDVGFIVFSSFGNGYRLTGNEDYKNVILKAAESLSTRFDPNVGCIRSWNSKDGSYLVIIDNMMNLELLLWASQNGGPSNLYDMAVSHALKTMENHVRADGSTYHVVDYYQDTGKVRLKRTHQGYADESVWARGQAWGIYGFTMVYRYTKDKRFLETAQKIADYYVDNLPEDCVPYWDFKAPNIPREERDTSAAAIAASGLLELSTMVDNPEIKSKYLDTAAKTLASLSTPAYLSKGTGNPAILLHAVGNKPGKSEVDVPLIYGDYYYIQALMRYKDMSAGTKK